MKVNKIFLAPGNETWEQALDRFRQFGETDMKELFAHKDYSYRFVENKAYAYQNTGLVSANSIQDFTNLNNISVPSSLINLLCKHGAFCIGDGLLEIFRDGSDCRILTLSQILAEYGYSEFIDRIGPGMMKSLSGYYYFFGVSFPQSEEIGFLYFNKAGDLGKMLFSPNNPELVLRKILPAMFNGSIDKYSLDSLISNQIDRIIINALTVRGYID